MPANMMNAAVGAIFTVTGNNSAMVSAGPMPGSTPMAVPSIDPRKAHMRLRGCNATPKPASRESSACMSDSRQGERAAQRDAELGEPGPAPQAQQQADDAVQHEAPRTEGMGHQREGEHGGQRKAQRAHGKQRDRRTRRRE